MKISSDITKTQLLSADFVEELFLEEDPTVRQESITKCEEIAKTFGCKGQFKDFVKAQKAAIRVERKRMEEEAASKSLHTASNTYTIVTSTDDVINYMTGRWKVSENGIISQDGKVISVASYYPVIITKIFTDRNTNNEKLELTWKKNGVIRSITAPRNVLSASNKIVDLSAYGFPVTTETAGNMIKYLSDFEALNNIATDVCSSKFGWADGEFIPYTDSIAFDSTAGIKSLTESVHSEGDFETWLDITKKIRASGRKEPLVGLAASFGSVLLKPTLFLPFIVNLYGTTGSGKTVTLMLASSVWANPSEGGYISESNSTINALEMKLDVLNHLPLMVDDLSKLRSDNKAGLMDLIYGLCSGQGKNRLNRNGEIKYTPTWRNSIMTNMERPLSDDTMRGGAMNRILDFEVDPGDIYKDGNQVVNILAENYGTAGPLFVEAIKDIGTDALRAMVKKYRQKIKEYAYSIGEEKEEKQITPMAIMLTADLIAEQIIFKDGIHMDFEWSMKSVKSKGQVSEMERAYKHFIDAYHMYQARFNDESTNFGEVWGKKQFGDYVAIIPTALDKIAEQFNFNRNQFVKWCKENEYLYCEQGRNQMSVSFSGSIGRTRCYVIKLDDSERYVINGDKDTGPEEPLPFDIPD